MTDKEYLQTLEKYFSTEDKEKQCELEKEILKYNDELVEKYHFLKLRNVYTDEESENNFYTWLDDIPRGWRIAFGLHMCEELKQALLHGNEKTYEDYRIHQVKEKYGQLRWYTSFDTDETSAIVDKYSVLSETTCITCGEPAEYSTKGWVSPYCKKCADNIVERKNKISTKYKYTFDECFHELKKETEE